MSPPKQQPPRFFLDRSLGRKAVPEGLRMDGWDIVTLAEHYGVPADEQVADVDWIEEAARQGWPILMKDKRIRHLRWSIGSSPTGQRFSPLSLEPVRTSTRSRLIGYLGYTRSSPVSGSDG